MLEFPYLGAKEWMADSSKIESVLYKNKGEIINYKYQKTDMTFYMDAGCVCLVWACEGTFEFSAQAIKACLASTQ